LCTSQLAKLPRSLAKAHRLAAQAVEEARSAASHGTARVHEWFPHWNVTSEVSGDSPYRGLVLKADKWRPDLLVVGSYGKSATGRALLGSVSQQVLAVQSARFASRDPEKIRRD
jgi:nucleotide-binding universal stress UspA family protein